MPRSERSFTVEDSGAFVELFDLPASAPGPLDGLRFAVKDLIDVGGYRTSFGNPTWRETHPPAVVNAVCVDQLLQGGARCCGKTVTDELAFSLDGENHFFGTPLNPRAPNRVPGGSSSGSASAVACGLVDFALGSDTGGSIRVPASNCGIYGLRPSPGRVSVAGVLPLAPTFDTVGVFANDAQVLYRAARVLLSLPSNDSDGDVGTVHVLSEAFASADKEVQDALRAPLDTIRRLFPGHVRETSLSEIGSTAGLDDWYQQIFRAVQWHEIWSVLGSWVESAQPELGPQTRRGLERVRDLDRSSLAQAIARREELFRAMHRFLDRRNLLCIPTTPALAPIRGSLGPDRRLGRYYPRTLALTSIAGIARLPQISLPLADVGGVPVGLSLLAANGEDAFLLDVVQRIPSRDSHP